MQVLQEIYSTYTITVYIYKEYCECVNDTLEITYSLSDKQHQILQNLNKYFKKKA